MILLQNECSIIQVYNNFIVNRDHSDKSKEIRVVTYICRYSSGHLIPNLTELYRPTNIQV